MPYYQKFYTLSLPDEATQQHLGLDWIDKSVSGRSGPVQASFAGDIENPMPKAWVETFRELGLRTTADPFGGSSIGAYNNMSTFDSTTKTRSYAASCYAAPVMSRPNLTFVFGAEVQKILLRNVGSSVEAHAVEVVVSGQVTIFKAHKEVILAAGVSQSPKLLELSGIGGLSCSTSMGSMLSSTTPTWGRISRTISWQESVSR